MASESKAAALGIFEAQPLNNGSLLVRHIHYERANVSAAIPVVLCGEIEISGIVLPVGPI